MTSHASQSKTVEHVVVAAERLTAKAAYVACSRGQVSCVVHTPDKAALLDRLPDGNREAALDRLSREIAAVQRITETEAVKEIEAALAKGPRRGPAKPEDEAVAEDEAA